MYSIYRKKYIATFDIVEEIYWKIMQINRCTVYWYEYNKVCYLVDLDVQPVYLVILNNFGTAFVYTVTF